MRTKVITAILLLLMAISTIYASEDPTEQTEYLQKKQQLDLLAERFKAETGFTGEIQYSHEQMSLGVIEGKFEGITISSAADTTDFRAVFNQILDKVLPYSKASMKQLTMTPISRGWSRIKTDYYQVVDGYKVEGAGWIGVEYDFGRDRFAVGNNAVCLPEVCIASIISKKQAEEIALQDKKDVSYTKAHTKQTFYTNIGSNEYYLAYLIYVIDESNPFFGDYKYYVNAVSGKVMLKQRERFIHYNVSVRAMGKDYIESSVWNIPPNYFTIEPINDVEVSLFPYTEQSNYDGYATFTDVIDNVITIKLRNTLYKMSASSDTLNALHCTIDSIDTSHQYTVLIPDSLYYAPNAYIEANKHISNLMCLNHNLNYNHNYLNIILFATPPDYTSQTFGGYSPENGYIWLRDGRLSDVIRHELSHHFIHNVLGVRSFDAPDTIHINTGAMDEACANYLCGAPTGNSILPGIGNYTDMASVISIPTNAAVNETTYSSYEFGLCISSAWWSLKNNQYFGQVELGVNSVDTLLVNGLEVVRRELPINSTYRYKPRYFYNLLMQRVADTGQTTGLNDKQRAIDAAYSSRGLHFNPKVESVSSSLKARNIFRLNEPVHVKVSNCPQNTRINVYVIKHNDYTYLDGALTSDLSNHYAHGFTPNTTAITNSSGEWSGLIWTTPSSAEDAVGDYDIIVDLGSPTTPDGIIHFTFSAANVMDGIDGRTKPGFIVTDNGIDVVMAEQASAETQLAEIHQ